VGDAGVLSDLRPNGIVNLPDVFLILIAVDEWRGVVCCVCIYKLYSACAKEVSNDATRTATNAKKPDAATSILARYRRYPIQFIGLREARSS
jgi:hypothetical protein